MQKDIMRYDEKEGNKKTRDRRKSYKEQLRTTNDAAH